MSLSVSLFAVREVEIYSGNITHNLTTMAREACLYDALWHPERLGIEIAEQLINPLSKGLVRLKECPEEFKKFRALNGWGTYEDFVCFVENYLEACTKDPKAKIAVSR